MCIFLLYPILNWTRTLQLVLQQNEKFKQSGEEILRPQQRWFAIQVLRLLSVVKSQTTTKNDSEDHQTWEHCHIDDYKLRLVESISFYLEGIERMSGKMNVPKVQKVTRNSTQLKVMRKRCLLVLVYVSGEVAFNVSDLRLSLLELCSRSIQPAFLSVRQNVWATSTGHENKQLSRTNF